MLKIGDKTKEWGTVQAVGFISGERYYWFIDNNDIISMIPAAVAESK